MRPAFANPTSGAVQPAPIQWHRLDVVPIVEVAYPNDMWKQLPLETSRGLLEEYWKGYHSGYTWDWGQQHGKDHYILDFNTGIQRNVDSGTIRHIRVIWLHPALATPHWTGQTIGTPWAS